RRPDPVLATAGGMIYHTGDDIRGGARMNTTTRRAGWSAVLLVAASSAFLLGRASHPYALGSTRLSPTFAVSNAPDAGGAPMAGLPDFRAVAKQVVPAVVTVRSQKTVRAEARSPFAGGPFRGAVVHRFFGGPGQRSPREQRYVQRGLGSGVIVSKDGYIITNNHVVEGVDKVEVVIEGQKAVTAKILGVDPPTDLAVIKIDEPS